jgi:hypothetical protein
MRPRRQAQTCGDQHGDVGSAAVDLGEDAVEDPSQLAQVAQHFDEAHDGHVAHVGEQACAGRRHVISAQPERLQHRPQCVQPFEQLTGVDVARRLATGQQDAWGLGQDGSIAAGVPSTCLSARTVAPSPNG